jgi:Protein of unknown function (DUF3104)
VSLIVAAGAGIAARPLHEAMQDAIHDAMHNATNPSIQRSRPQPVTAPQLPIPPTHTPPPRFLAVRVGDRVAVAAGNRDWWIGDVIHAEGGARCGANSLFQIACVDSGVIRTINADAVIDILQSQALAADSGALQPANDHPHQQQ